MTSDCIVSSVGSPEDQSLLLTPLDQLLLFTPPLAYKLILTINYISMK